MMMRCLRNSHHTIHCSLIRKTERERVDEGTGRVGKCHCTENFPPNRPGLLSLSPLFTCSSFSFSQ